MGMIMVPGEPVGGREVRKNIYYGNIGNCLPDFMASQLRIWSSL
jgi:hypothetical protein